MLSLKSKSITTQLGRFTIAGVVNTAIGYALIFGGMALGLSPYASNLIGYVAGLICSFFFSQRFVFSVSNRSWQQVPRFVVSFAIAYIANFITLYIALQFEMGPAISQIVAGVVYLLVMFIFSRVWVFKK